MTFNIKILCFCQLYMLFFDYFSNCIKKFKLNLLFVLEKLINNYFLFLVVEQQIPLANKFNCFSEQKQLFILISKLEVFLWFLYYILHTRFKNMVVKINEHMFTKLFFIKNFLWIVFVTEIIVIIIINGTLCCVTRNSLENKNYIPTR